MLIQKITLWSKELSVFSGTILILPSGPHKRILTLPYLSVPVVTVKLLYPLPKNQGSKPSLWMESWALNEARVDDVLPPSRLERKSPACPLQTFTTSISTTSLGTRPPPYCRGPTTGLSYGKGFVRIEWTGCGAGKSCGIKQGP